MKRNLKLILRHTNLPALSTTGSLRYFVASNILELEMMGRFSIGLRQKKINNESLADD